MLCRINNIRNPGNGGIKMTLSVKKFVAILFVFALMIINIILLSPVIFAADHTYSWVDGSYNSLTLSNYTLCLPLGNEREQNFKVFSPDAQKRLLNIASLYGERNSDLSLQVSTGEIDKNTILNDTNSIKFKPLPNIEINADYDREEKGLEAKIEKNINLEYQMNENTWIRAGYLLTNKEWWDIKQISLQGDKVNEDKMEGENTDEVAEKESEVMSVSSSPNSDTDEESTQQTVISEKVYNFEQTYKGNLGISYKTSDRVTISADYISGDINDDVFTGDTFSTIFGVEYVDDQGELRASYEIDRDNEMEETVTGLELNLNDLATFSASYKLLDPKMLRNQLDSNQSKADKNEETVWDFGVDFDLSEVSSLSIGYKLINNKESSDEKGSNDIEDKKEESIKASFQIEF